MLCSIFISFQTKLAQTYHIDLNKMYVYCVLYANTYYDLIIMFMRFIIIIIIIYFEIIFFTICLTFRSCLFPQGIDLSMILNFYQTISYFVICLKKYN